MKMKKTKKTIVMKDYEIITIDEKLRQHIIENCNVKNEFIASQIIAYLIALKLIDDTNTVKSSEIVRFVLSINQK
jgi:hypothetical protein